VSVLFPDEVDMTQEIGAMLRRALPLDGELPKPLTAGEGDPEAMQDFVRDCKAWLGADAEATPEATAAHLIKRYFQLIEEITEREEMADLDLDAYDFAKETDEVVKDQERRIRAISAAMRTHGFKDPTRHAYTRAWLKRLQTQEAING
jgi:hypothetical protein